jgi:uncharacterized membrane protein
MGALITIALIAVVAHLWRRLNLLQARVDQLETHDFSYAAVEPAALRASELVQPDVPVEVSPVASFEPADVEPPGVEKSSILTAETQEIEDSQLEELHDEPDEPSSGFSFEDIFGRRLPIWAGGITLAIAGMLIVKYSIDAGLISPVVRVIAGLIFGVALIGGAEAALRAHEKVRDPRVRQALSGAGVASLYGAILIAANLYGLIDPVVAFLGMAAVTALAMGLSLRFGAPSALLGLAGGLAAPALVGSGEPNIPLLASYLALAVGGLSILSRSQRWMWLGVAALTGGFGWAGVLLIGGTLDALASVSLGIYLLLLGIVLPLVAFSGRLGNAVRIAGSIVAAAQMAGLVATGGFAPLHWGLFGLISAGIIWLASREEGLARLPAVGLVIALMLLVAWPDPTPVRLAIVMLVGAALYFLPALRTLWRPDGSMLEAAQIAAISAAGLAIPIVHFFRFDGTNDVELALAGLGASLVPAAAAMLGWSVAERREDARFALLATTAALLLASAAALALPSWSLAPLFGLLGLGLVVLSLAAQDRRVAISGWLIAGAGLVSLTIGYQAQEEFARLFGVSEAVDLPIALIRWGGLAAIAGLLAWRGRFKDCRGVAQAIAALLVYGTLAQFLGSDALAIACALGLVGLAFWSVQLERDTLLPAFGSVLALSVLWAAGPLVEWAAAGAGSLFAQPMLVGDLPSVRQALLQLLVPSGLLVGAWWLSASHVSRKMRMATLAFAGVFAGVALHVLFKQLWSIDSAADFVRFGLIERISWEALLFGAALLAWRFDQGRIALGLTAAGLAHFSWYTMILHNPLIADQHVGNTFVANLLLPAYALPLLWLWVLDRRQGSIQPMVDRVLHAAPMLLILLFAFSTVRQMFHGSILTVPGVTEWEDIFRSIVAIVLAIGFLLWGIRSGSRDWRIASLGLMIAAVAKVFLVDASGLDGLLRIASFVALGLSLIGIGWLYSRFLGTDRLPAGT